MFLTEKELGVIRGKMLVGKASQDEILSLFAHYDELEDKLYELSASDFFGTEGYKRFLGLPE